MACLEPIEVVLGEAAFEVASARCTYNALITPLLAEIEKVARQTS